MHRFGLPVPPTRAVETSTPKLPVVTIEEAPRNRLGVIQEDAVLVVRGGALDPALATADAARFRRR